jgi:hypothetical protein
MRCALFLLLISSPVLAETPSSAPAEQAKKKSPYRWYVVPNVAFDTDDGLGFGARGELAIDAPGHRPYKTAFVAHAFASLRGFHHHRLRYDRTGLPPDRRLRLTLHLAWRQWLNDGYWGLGNGTLRERAFAADFDDDDPARKRYRYSLFQPFAHATLRAAMHGPWSLFSSLNVKYSIVETYAGSLLAEQRPFGIDGGLGLILSVGLLLDTRDPEIDPQRGILAELSARAALPFPGSAGTFGGILASLRGFLPLHDRLVVAGRIMVEVLMGEVPFYEMVHWGGAIPVAGFGGFETLRGNSFGRWRAPGKAILNTELRLRVLRHTLFGKRMDWQLAAIGDAGIVFAAGEETTGPQGGIPIHPAGGLGLRAIYSRAFVGRIDAGLGVDPVREADGSVSHEVSFGIYIVFDHAF